MKKLILVVIMFLVIGGMGGSALAEDAPPVEPLGWNLTYFNGTGITAFYFPTDSTIAGGLNTNLSRVSNNDPANPFLSKLSIDLDATIAKEFNEAKDTLYGLGLKLNYAQTMTSKSGIVFEPSIGATALRNMKDIKEFSDAFRNFKFALYGNVVLYKF